VVLTVLASVCLQFVFQTVNTILIATHQPSKTSIISLLGQLFVLIAIFVLKQFVPANLELLVLVLAGMPLLIMLIASIYLYKTTLKEFVPSFRNIDFSYARPLLNLGSKFFIIQIGALVLFQTDNIIITRILGPESVTQFNVAYKLFAVVMMAFNIIITPYWSAFTDAYAKQDYEWIKKSMRLMRRICLLLSMVCILLWLASGWIYHFWIGDTVSINSELTIAMVLYTIAYMWQTTHVFLLNGVGKVRLQLILVIISAILNIPLAVLLGNSFGIAGIISASIFLFFIMGFIFFKQTEKIINKNAKGIWNK
jgi:O-antigen/teichoic acid export membrane protein